MSFWCPSQFSSPLNYSAVEICWCHFGEVFVLSTNFLDYNLLTNGTTVHRPHSVQLPLPPASFSSLSSYGQDVMYKCEGQLPVKTSSHQKQQTGGSQCTSSLPECVSSCPNLNLGASRILHDCIMPLCCDKMPKYGCTLRCESVAAHWDCTFDSHQGHGHQ